MADLIDAACRWVPRNMNQIEWNQYMEGPYRPTCSSAPIPLDVIESIRSESQKLIQQGEIISATQRLEQINGWFELNNQFNNFGLDVADFVAQVVATATSEALKPSITPRPNHTPTPQQSLSPLNQSNSPLVIP